MSVSGDWLHWGTVIGAGVVTLAARASFIVLPPGIRVPSWLQRALKFVAAAVLPALILPDVLFREVPAGQTVNYFRLVAMLVAMAVAYKSRSIIATLATGMVALWLLMWGWAG
ncbi:MAG: AzlD domain-containing protein [Betaproteobacteria bacterium]|nr:AzlD domain-containing protein [Betaproteobacteria bacterium]